MPPLKLPRHEKFAREIVKPENRLQADRAYKKISPDVTDESARVRGSILASTPEVKARISELLDQSGLSIQNLNKKLTELTNADKAIVVDSSIQYVPDNGTQIDAAKTAYKLHGLLTSVTDTFQVNNTQVNIVNADKEDCGKLIEKLTSFARILHGDSDGEVDIVDMETVNQSTIDVDSSADKPVDIADSDGVPCDDKPTGKP